MQTIFSSFLFVRTLVFSPVSLTDPVGITLEVSSEAPGRTTVK